jgi:hypothetical protein
MSAKVENSETVRGRGRGGRRFVVPRPQSRRKQAPYKFLSDFDRFLDSQVVLVRPPRLRDDLIE